MVFHKLDTHADVPCQLWGNDVYHQIMTRRYRMDHRAAKQAATRQKIVEAAIELHQKKGIAATSMRDVASRAGVGVVTVYRHFADDLELLASCSGTYFERHPFPDPEQLSAISDPESRLRQGLRDTYTYHRKTAPMMMSVIDEIRDAPISEPYFAHWRYMAEALSSAWSEPPQRDELLTAGIELALQFDTWKFLTSNMALTDDNAVELMMRLSSKHYE